jgi:hypothetical protein
VRPQAYRGLSRHGSRSDYGGPLAQEPDLATAERETAINVTLSITVGGSPDIGRIGRAAAAPVVPAG